MFRYTIDADPNTNVDVVLTTLVRNSRDAGATEADTTLLAQSTSEVLRALCEQGKQLSALGSQMSVTRDVAGKGFHIRINFRSSRKRGLLARLLGR